MTSNDLSSATKWLASSQVAGWLDGLLQEVPDYFWTVPASSTGKYHPPFAAGTGGLVRHTRACVYYALQLGESRGLSSQELDLAIAALVLHDSWKQGDGRTGHTVWDHPVIASDWIVSLGAPKGSQREVVAEAVRSHMGKHGWGPVEPVTGFQWFVHTCDFLASRKELNIDLDKAGV